MGWRRGGGEDEGSGPVQRGPRATAAAARVLTSAALVKVTEFIKLTTYGFSSYLYIYSGIFSGPLGFWRKDTTAASGPQDTLQPHNHPRNTSPHLISDSVSRYIPEWVIRPLDWANLLFHNNRVVKVRHLFSYNWEFSAVLAPGRR